MKKSWMFLLLLTPLLSLSAYPLYEDDGIDAGEENFEEDFFEEEEAAFNQRTAVKRPTAPSSSARSKIRDARQNSNRPQVTQRKQESNPAYDEKQTAADASLEDQYDYPSVSPRERVREYGQKKSRQKKGYRPAQKSQRKSGSIHHPGKRPLGE